MTAWLHNSPANHRFEPVSTRSMTTSARSSLRRSVSLGLVVSLTAVTVALVLNEFFELSMVGLTIAVAIGSLAVSLLQWGFFSSNRAHVDHVDRHDHRQAHVPLKHAS